MVPPWAFTPCYEVDTTYMELMKYEREESGDLEIIKIDEIGLEAILMIDDQLILEVVSSTQFEPSREGTRVVFEKF